MIQFIVKSEAKPKSIVELSTAVDVDGNAVIRANGITLLWVTPEGQVLMNSGGESEGQLTMLGFRMESDPHSSGRKRVQVR